MGAVIVNPETHHPIVVCQDLRCTGHPLKHAVMVCIDLVAHSQSSGAWQLDYKEVNGTWMIKDSDQPQRQQNVNSVDSETCFMECNSSDTRTLLDENSSVARETSNLDNRCKSGPYLCTGYDLYVTREPCVM